jgi:hypothetical protein
VTGRPERADRSAARPNTIGTRFSTASVGKFFTAVAAIRLHRIVQHNGGGPGASGWLQIYWDDGYTLAALSNYADPRVPNLGVGPIVQKTQQLLAYR